MTQYGDEKKSQKNARSSLISRKWSKSRKSRKARKKDTIIL